MNKYWILLVTLLFPLCVFASTPEDAQLINASLNDFVVSWNKGDMKSAMNIYKNDSDAMLISEKVIKGYPAIVDFWMTSYPKKEDMGKMQFSDIEVKPLSDRFAMAIGKWSLVTPTTKTGGIFTVLFEKTNQGWKSVIDHTTGL